MDYVVRLVSPQALLLEKQRHVYEADICALHASTMALVHDVSYVVDRFIAA